MINHSKVKKHSIDMIEHLKEMEQLVTTFKPKTASYNSELGSDISNRALSLMEEILKTVKDLRKTTEEKTSEVRGFATKLGETEKKISERISEI